MLLQRQSGRVFTYCEISSGTGFGCRSCASSTSSTKMPWREHIGSLDGVFTRKGCGGYHGWPMVRLAKSWGLANSSLLAAVEMIS